MNHECEAALLQRSVQRLTKLWRCGVRRTAPRRTLPAGLFVAFPRCGRAPAWRRVSAARRDPQTRAFHSHFDLMKTAVARRRRRVITQHVVTAVRVDNAAERIAQHV